MIFMDMAISIKKGKIETALYSKTPRSADILTGLIYGMILRIYQLCSKEVDVDREMYLFMRRILDHGHNLDEITTLFWKPLAMQRSISSRAQSTGKNSYIRKHRQLRDRCTFTYLFIPTTPLWTPRGIGSSPFLNLMGSCN